MLSNFWCWSDEFGFFLISLSISKRLNSQKKKLEINLWISEAEISKFELIKTTFLNQFKVIDFIVQLCDNDLFTRIWKITKIVADVEWKRNSHTNWMNSGPKHMWNVHECWQSFNSLSRRNLLLVYWLKYMFDYRACKLLIGA